MKPVKEILSQIANDHLLIPTLEIRRADSLDFHSVSVWVVETALQAAFDAGCNSVEAEGVDIHEIAAKRRQIAMLWSVEDVQEVRPDLTDDQAWEVLQRAHRQHDATIGINWDTLQIWADEMFDAPPDA